MKPYYHDKKNGITIYHGDCRRILPKLSFDVVVSDPPYGINQPTNYKSRGLDRLALNRDFAPVYGDKNPFDPTAFLHWPCILWGANHYADKLPSSSGWLVWDKQRPDVLNQWRCELAWTNFVGII